LRQAPTNPRTVLGIDPGLATTGWGVVHSIGGSLQLRGVGVIETTAGLPLPQRLLTIRDRLSAIIREHQPIILVIEQLFFTKFATSIAATAQARGVILVTAEAEGLPVVELNPRTVKIGMTGFGSASKFQMQSAVQRILSLKEIPKPDDAADALAMALCHLQTQPLIAAKTTRRSRAAWEADLLQRADAGRAPLKTGGVRKPDVQRL
jgi:crossover junction endodeoxyribonuclease RuvC